MSYAHVQNADLKTVGYWLKRGREELIVYVFSVKGYERRRWKVETLTVMAPQATERYSQADLMMQGIVGLYAERQEGH